MRKIYILSFFIVLAFCSQAQDTLQCTTTQYNIHGLDTTSNHSFFVTDSLVYVGPQATYISNISFAAKCNSTLLDTSQFVSPTFTTNDTFFRGAAQPVTFRINNDTAPPFIIGGPNVVVIWPVYSGGHAGPRDSVFITAYYFALGIAETPLAHMYIFQSNQSLNIHFGDAEKIVQQVRIYDLEGRVTYSGLPQRSENIPTEAWQKGVYFCEISTQSGERRVFKFLLSE